MVTPLSKTREELRKLNNNQLLDYFNKHARKIEISIKGAEYAIRVGSYSIFSHDTDDLCDKFFNVVKGPNNVRAKLKEKLEKESE